MASNSLGNLLVGLLYSFPLGVVALGGIALALARWRCHPRISALVAGSLAAYFLAGIARFVATWFLMERVLTAGGPNAIDALVMGGLHFAAAIIRTGAWVAILAATFGERKRGDGTHHRVWQFSIRGLMLLTLAVAIFLGLARLAVSFLGPGAGMFIALIPELPLIVCWLAGAWVAVARWKWHPPVSALVLAAVGLSLFMLLFSAGAWIWFVQTSTPGARFPQIISFAGGIAVAGTWALMTAAALGWRQPPETGEELLPVGGLARDASG